jgi:hypothetical protein
MGNQRGVLQLTIYYSELPRLSSFHHRKTSDPTSEENCIAHAAGARGEWWEPVEGRIWPVGPPHDNYEIDSLVRVYQTLGYFECDSEVYESGFEKIAIYGKHGIYEHATRQLSDGTWTSKLGPEDDINHSTLEALVGGCYGEVVRIMKKRLGLEYEEAKCCEDATRPAQ